MELYPSNLLIVSQLTLEPEIDVIAPPMDVTVAAFVVGHIKVTPAAVADIVRKFILELWRKWGYVGLSKRHSAAIWRWPWPQAMNSVVAEQPTVVVLDVAIAAGTVRLVVDDLAFGGAQEVSLHPY